jgi:hypothetical protein
MMATTSVGRPTSHARRLLLAVLQSGTFGTFDVLAACTGLPCHIVRQTLSNMRQAGQVRTVRNTTCHKPQSSRAIYCLAPPEPETERFDALQFVSQVWR